jgi:hypothetical protein
VDYCSALAATVCHAVCCLPLHWPTLELSDSQSGLSSASLLAEHYQALFMEALNSLQAKQVLSARHAEWQTGKHSKLFL